MTPSNPSSNADARSGMNDTSGVTACLSRDNQPNHCVLWKCHESKACARGVALGDGAEQRVEAFAARRLAEIRGCKLGCGAVGQCKANAHGIPSDCPARGVKASDGGDRG
jgi:hypothetical protein